MFMSSLFQKKCILKIQKIARPIEPSLFQHEGLHSSLQGTVNKLKDKSYGINQTSIHRNPSIENIISTIKQYSKYDIFSAYMGQDVFWGANPKAGDLVDFLFHPPIPISRVYFASGDKGHPGDKFQNTTIEILPVKPPPVTSAVNKLVVQKDPSGNQTSQQKLAFEQRVLYLADLPKDSMLDTFYVVGKFDEQGRAKAEIPVDFKDIQVVRLRILSDLPNWVILSQIVIEMPQKR
ncbi:alpha-1,3-mannosyl-glycoprotein 4-beta-N-acetylglucosaminyltransferase B-like [Aplysia californica]|uniref:Alpha-1,3-mannosyl-glycoprotein 4-beta-N-acetylglucosaminyltransferase B-like n=1 Tax=Aplysia californica TaxID=6500 RepID=A0ABM1W3R5_APLCA|nr:alpha-1,3-mannosyl-glycoprotein 4-beta-N-acetylglucosaminyltransferase B-like [Aplysia californica]